MALLRPDIPQHVAEIVRHLHPDLKPSVKAAIRTLATNPRAGEPLIKALEGLWKYRIRGFRVVYDIELQRNVLRIVAIGHRRRIYEEVTDWLSRRRK